MTTIGDSFAVVAILFGIGLTAWAMMLTFGLLFMSKASLVRERFERNPRRGFLTGVLWALGGGGLSLVLLNLPAPALKLVGTVGLLLLISVAMFGLSGLALLIASRIRSMDPEVSLYGSLVRATMLLVVGGFFPFVGWFLIGPILLISGLGAGMGVLLQRSTIPTVETR